MDYIDISIAILSLIYFMLPAYIANLSGLVFGGGKALDFGKFAPDGRRIIGDGVTWKGAIVGTILGSVIGVLQGLQSGNVLYGLFLGFILGFGAMLGDAIGSFIKRRLKIQRGKPVLILDQLDFVVVAILLSLLITNYGITGFNFLYICIITIFLHLGSNIIAYLFGIKDVWY
ncbi:MAG: CDP-2,3-bis-(O-geranylgeranyl)-sn-glycerol synthase [Methanobacteriaceae archaeon]